MLTALNGDWTYAQDPSTSDVDTVRFTMQDVDPDLPLLTDLEVQYLIDKWLPLYSSLTYVAAVAAAHVSRKFVGMTSITADGVSVNVSDLAKNYADLAVQLRDEANNEAEAEGEAEISNILYGNEWDPSIAPMVFGMDLHDNPYAGGQDRGGWGAGPWDPSGLVGGW